jgi:hypothetical protein
MFQKKHEDDQAKIYEHVDEVLKHFGSPERFSGTVSGFDLAR